MSALPIVKSLAVVLKVIGLTVLLFLAFAVANLVLGVGDAVEQSPSESSTASRVVEAPAADQSAAAPAQMALAALFMCFLQTVVVTTIILPSRWYGWHLIITVFAISFVMSAVLTQMESVVFLPQIGLGLIGRIVAASALSWAVFSVVAVWILGRGKRGFDDASQPLWVSDSRRSWGAALAGLGVLHLILYFVFGYYFAWRVPEVAQFYGGEDPGSLWAQLVLTARFRTWFFPFQFVRGVLWGILAIPIAVMVVGSRLKSALIAAGVFAVLVPSQLLLPNPYMPDTVRMTHLVETLFSRLLFGFVAVYLLRSTLVNAVRDSYGSRNLWSRK